MPAPRILVFAGSWREGSLNTKLATLAARKLHAAGAHVRQISLGDYPLPLVDATGFGNAPQAAHELRALIDAHDGLYIASPEYNAGYAPALKNALDWASTAKPGAPASGLAGKVVALGGASTGSLGAYRGLTQLRTSLELGFGALMVPEMVAVSFADKMFDADGNLTDARSSGFLDAQVARLLKLSGKGL
ncbi:NADPH-dependent FMN reductase [Bosea sp. BIWAKO-01]|uniref:NADPH-dependent FMN reductase n=1 Tax=Bosea sp. BIWAKO-01 TaxID=506668 RepID=UPI000853E67E|nr:NADPH-dependent FMN reductase [Bosea sp. BIWAKO-01]GAU81930.1 NADPH:quinone oxidoreductase [Bosea sp. BIWAKO-01]